ncbi:methylamine dehydrogenase light chain [Congregibacter litoralis]|uniref:Methylamine dehydrogenase small subunit n=1 Tax=Congregibacter litoralis KT71 TaxID=314285 RepID=A4A7G4_9GAMM|nr:methylamine dehydrogenase light chain [Congregibacter litoralis]EAQ98233.1 methylamine dehydrogenase small subunit precursor [Congregibacter litoralis KT71]
MSTQNHLLKQLLDDIDAATTGAVRFFAGRTSRRSFLGKLGAVATGMGAFPLLPMAREDAGPMQPESGSNALAAPAAGTEDAIPEMGDNQSCDYWRYCAFSGQICSCCGGSMTQCPPGSETASVAWVGTCHNPLDGQDYLISYNDCCGKSACGRCGCHRSEGDRPVYFPSKSNSILWCFGSNSHAYHCTLARVVGKADAG